MIVSVVVTVIVVVLLDCWLCPRRIESRGSRILLLLGTGRISMGSFVLYDLWKEGTKIMME